MSLNNRRPVSKGLRSARRRSGFAAFLWMGGGESGMAATEFALILPVMLLLFSGIFIYGTAIEMNRKITLTARTITDLVTQYETLTTADMTTLMNATAQTMAPFSLTGVNVTVGEISITSAGVATIVWSEALNSGTITKPAPNYAPGTAVTVPANMVQSVSSGQCPPRAGASSPGAGNCLIWGNVSYVFTPGVGYQLTGPITLAENIYMNPRLSTGVLIDQSTTTP